jgi:hypothetical protein
MAGMAAKGNPVGLDDSRRDGSTYVVTRMERVVVVMGVVSCDVSMYLCFVFPVKCVLEDCHTHYFFASPNKSFSTIDLQIG